MTTTSTRFHTTEQSTTSVPIAGAHDTYQLVVHPSGATVSVSCEERGLSVRLDPAARRRLGRLLLDAVLSLSLSPRRPEHLQSVGAVEGTLPEHGMHRFEIDVVCDEDEDMHVVLLTCEALAIDGVLQAAAARRLGELLLQT